MKHTIFTALVITVALGLVQPGTAMAGKVKKIDFVSKNKLKQACTSAGGSWAEAGNSYGCVTDNAGVACDGPSQECYGELTQARRVSTGTFGSTMAKPKAKLMAKPKAKLKMSR